MDTQPKYTLDEYKQALRMHDWAYEFSDDHSVWLRGKTSQTLLYTMAQQLDPELTIYRLYIPDYLKA